MPSTLNPRRAVRMKTRSVDEPRLFAFPTGNGATALPEILSESTYTPLATLKPGDAPTLLGNGIYGYLTGAEEKMIALEFCSVAGANNETQVWEFGAYAFPYLNRTTSTYTGWKCYGTANFTMTLGARTLASQTTDPFVGSQAFSSSTIRWADTYTESTNDFNNSTAGMYQFFSIGYGGSDKSGHLIVDLSFSSLICIRLVTKAGSSTQELVGLYNEIN